MEKQINEMSTSELEALLKTKKKAEAAARTAEKEKYEKSRDNAVLNSMDQATKLARRLSLFKTHLHQLFDKHKELLDSYGGIRANSKGGFSLVHTDGELKISRIRSTEPVWDERGTKAVGLIKEFLADTVKKRDKKLFEILCSFIEKNKDGDLEYSRVMLLFQHQDKYDDARWVEGLKLIKESYSTHLRAYRYDFFVKDENGKWKRIDLNFSAL